MHLFFVFFLLLILLLNIAVFVFFVIVLFFRDNLRNRHFLFRHLFFYHRFAAFPSQQKPIEQRHFIRISVTFLPKNCKMQVFWFLCVCAFLSTFPRILHFPFKKFVSIVKHIVLIKKLLLIKVPLILALFI